MSIKLWIAAAAAVLLNDPYRGKAVHHSHVLMELTGPIPYTQLAAVDTRLAQEYAEMSHGRMSSHHRHPHHHARLDPTAPQ